MTDEKILREKIAETGLKFNHIADSMGITRASLLNKISGKSEFKASEMASLTKILGLSLREKERIFFKK